MRFFVAPLWASIAILFARQASAALTVTDAPPPPMAIEETAFSEGGSQAYEKERRFRLEELKRAKAQKEVRQILIFAAPAALLLLGGGIFLWYRRRDDKSHFQAMHRELKRAEAKRRSGGGAQAMDPRQW